jgi:hypothetical protein
VRDDVAFERMIEGMPDHTLSLPAVRDIDWVSARFGHR